MTGKRLVARRRARRDIQLAVAYYLEEAGPPVARAFLASVEAAYNRIAEAPRIGSPRFGYELGFPGLRTKPVDRFPYLVFYVEQVDQVDIVRVLHAQRDIPRHMEERF